MYKALEAKVLADEQDRKQKERERRVSMGLPAEEGQLDISPAALPVHLHRPDALQRSSTRDRR
jgi:hypothetical protein